MGSAALELVDPMLAAHPILSALKPNTILEQGTLLRRRNHDNKECTLFLNI